MLAERIRPPWIAFSDPDLPVEDRIAAVPEGWQEVLEDAGLFESPASDDVQEWWSSIHNVNEAMLDELKARIGRKGEEATIDYERHRLEKAHRRDLADRITWVAEREDRFGFDVASFVVGLLPEMAAEAPLLIEVKASTSKSKERISFDLTRNEWDVAEMNQDNYLFYFWLGISPDEETDVQEDILGPIILKSSAIRSRIPSDSTTELGRWTKCHIELGFDEVSSQMVR